MKDKTMTNELTDCQKQLKATCIGAAQSLENPTMVDEDGTSLEGLGWDYNEDDHIWIDPDGNEHDPHTSHVIRQETGFDYLNDVLDIEYRIGADRKYKSGEVLIAFGGPNVWIDTKTNTVCGAWWGDKFSVPYTDKIGLDDALEELYEMGA